MRLESAPGRGFAFHGEMPVAVADAVEAAETGDEAAAPVLHQASRILVVDDSAVNRTVLKAMLGKLGFTEIAPADDGRQALAKLESEPAFDWVLTDMWMPNMDGAELIKAIRADPRFAKLTACSITADVEARKTYRDQGFDELLLKPITLEKLRELLGHLA